MAESANEQKNGMEKKIPVDEQTSFNMSVMEYDKSIAESELHTADLKSKKAAFIYEANLNNIVAQHEALQENQGKEQDVSVLTKEDSVPLNEASNKEVEKSAKKDKPLQSDTAK